MSGAFYPAKTPKTTPSGTDAPVVLRPGGGVRTPLMGAVLLFAALVAYLSITGRTGWPLWGAFALLLASGGWFLLDSRFRGRRSLSLAPEGFTESGTRGETTIAWHRIEAFDVYHILRIRLVGYRLKAGAPNAGVGGDDGGYRPPAALSRYSALPDGWLRGRYGMRPRALARLMNEWRERYGA